MEILLRTLRTKPCPMVTSKWEKSSRVPGSLYCQRIVSPGTDYGVPGKEPIDKHLTDLLGREGATSSAETLLQTALRLPVVHIRLDKEQPFGFCLKLKYV